MEYYVVGGINGSFICVDYDTLQLHTFTKGSEEYNHIMKSNSLYRMFNLGELKLRKFPLTILDDLVFDYGGTLIQYIYNAIKQTRTLMINDMIAETVHHSSLAYHFSCCYFVGSYFVVRYSSLLDNLYFVFNDYNFVGLFSFAESVLQYKIVVDKKLASRCLLASNSLFIAK